VEENLLLVTNMRQLALKMVIWNKRGLLSTTAHSGLDFLALMWIEHTVFVSYTV